MAEVFISYARKDKGFVRDIHAALQRLKRDTWVDWRDIPDSTMWRAEIFAAIGTADNFLFVISPDSVKSWMCGQEISYAVTNNKRLLTILYHSVETKELDPALAEVQWIDYPDLGFEQTFERLIKALDTNFDWEHKHTQLVVRAAEWESKNRDQGFLLHGMELKEAVRWLAQAATIKDRDPTELQKQYIRASEEWEAGEIQRLKDLNTEKERLARTATARERVAFSTLSLEEDPECGILLAMHAVETTRSAADKVLPEAEDALHRAILRSPIRLTIKGHAGPVYGVALSEDGRMAISASADRTLKVWEVASGRMLHTLADHTDAVTSVAISGDGRLAVSGSWDGTVKVWDVAHQRVLRTLEGHTDWVNGVALSENERIAISASSDKTLKVWDVPMGRELRTLKGHAWDVDGVAMSGDGRLAVSASRDGTLKVWEVETGQEVRTLGGPHRSCKWRSVE